MPGPHYADDLVTLHLGDCIDIMAGMPDASADAVVTDPPYGLGFMGKEWDSGKAFVERKADKRNTFDHVGGNHNPVDAADAARTRRVEGQKYGAWCEQWAAECLRVLKPGGHLLAFGGTRTYHRLACAVEDAGFEIRDSLHWVYGSGFPKSLDVSKAIDKAAGAEREIIGPSAIHSRGRNTAFPKRPGELTVEESGRAVAQDQPMLTAPATPDAARWSGWGTALKPAHEPIVVARKPLAGTVAGNVLEWGTGALNVDGCRVAYEEGGSLASNPSLRTHINGGNGGHIIAHEDERRVVIPAAAGRWPPNLLLVHDYRCNGECADGCPVAGLDGQSGALVSSKRQLHHDIGRTRQAAYGKPSGRQYTEDNTYGDSGGASRFFPVLNWDPEYDLPFMYCAKAPKSERPQAEGISAHPTVKPLAVMRWLVRLVTPPGGTVLDPFAGTGTTGQACALEGFQCVLAERDPDSAELARVRLAKPVQQQMMMLDGPA